MYKIKVLFLLPSLRGGGAERAILNLLDCIDKKRFEVELALISKEGDFTSSVPEGVIVHDLRSSRARYAVFKIVELVNKRKPDLIIGSVIQATNLIFIASFFFKHKPVIINRLENPYSKLTSKKLAKWLFGRALRSSDYVVAVSKGLTKDLMEHLNISEKKIKVIYNPVDLELTHALSKEEVNDYDFKNKKVVVTIARFTKQKGLEDIIRAFSIVAKEIKDAHLLIIGQGKLRKILEKLIGQLDLNKKVSLVGFKDNPYKYLAKADLFVLASLWEGFGLVIVEAMACGLPIVSTDCISGPSEILKNGKYGKLVPVGNPVKLADAIIFSLNDNLALSGGAVERIEEFSANKIIKEYELLFETLLR